jgi:hypothetical protein
MSKFVDKQWNKQYEKLVEFKRKQGNCLVPKMYQEDASLGKWVSTQRTTHINTTIRPERKGLLDDIGFVWRVGNYEPSWEKQYGKLVEFKRKHGNCLVQRGHKEDASLGRWVDKQRHFHRKNTILPERKGLLDEIGFVWGRVDKSAPWNKQYEKLVEFKRKNGHCLVPSGYQEDASLGFWVSIQRHTQFHSKNKIKSNRHVLLDEIGFVWKVDNVAARSSTTNVSCR